MEQNQNVVPDTDNLLLQHGTYYLMTGYFAGGPIWRRGKMFTDISADHDGLKIEMIPKKKNLYPYIKYSDILAVQEKSQIGLYWIFGMGLCAVGAVSGAVPALAGIPLCLLLGWRIKVSITLQGGAVAEIRGRNDAKRFAEDLRKFLESQK